MRQDYIVGIFVREEKNRFLCTVEVEGKEEECYIPSSCRLENFLELAGKEVLLRENQNKNARTRLAVYALKIKQNYLIFRTSEANSIIANELRNRRFSYLGKRSLIEREYTIEGYKSDIYLPEVQTIIEIKSLITSDSMGIFPTVYSERAIEQLRKIKHLIKCGYRFVYIFMSLNPYVKSISLSEDIRQSEYKKLFLECVNDGMIYKAYTSRLKEDSPTINKEIPIILEKY